MKKYVAFLLVIIISITIAGKAGAALPSRSKHSAPNPVTGNSASDAADEAAASSGHHISGGHHISSGHHGGGHVHYSHHSHHSYHASGHYHHYAEHYHHYHHHYHVYHAGSVGATDYAGLSILFDIFGFIPGFSLLGILFGAIGMHIGRRRGLAKAGLIIGVIEVVIWIAVLAVFGII